MKKIMVVDDDKDLLVVVKQLLKSEGYNVVVSTSCGEGLSLLASFKPDLIFLDINIGTDDGREMCRNIKALVEHSHIPIVLISANEDALKTYKEYGADSFIRKPIQRAHLLNLTVVQLSSGL